ncbi:MAG: hypothetical protein ABFS08_09295 [Pseudomonadota bacterium]
MTTLFVVLGLIAVALVFYLRLKMAINKSVNRIKQPPAKIPDDSVQCVSCGMVVPLEKALEKKGRYFCGVKRNDRNGNPVGSDKHGESDG